MKNRIHSLASWLIMLILPPILLITSILVLLNPLFLNLEYRRPGFPADEFGFTLQDRLQYATPSVAYLVNNQGIEYLSELTLPDGSPLYNERELSHMQDVKQVVQAAIKGWLVGLVTLGMLTLWAFRGHWQKQYWTGVAKGGFMTLALLMIFLFSAWLNFDALFTAFHGLFFTSGSWVFYITDSLIRLFPLPFWQDCFTIVGILTTLFGVLLAWQGTKQAQKA